VNEGFAQIAPYLKDPLVLVGFFMFLFFGFGRFVIKSRLIPQLSQRHGYRVLQTFLLYGFIAGLLIIALGFGLKYRELSKSEQDHVLTMLSQESAANTKTLGELAKNTETMLRLTATLATTLRHPGIPLLAALFPAQNIQPLASTPPPQQMAGNVFAALERSHLHEDRGELARFSAAGRLVHGTIDRTLSTVDSLADADQRRYRVYEEVWNAELPVLRKIDRFEVTPFQESYAQLRSLRANYDVVVRHVRDYMASVRDFFSGQNAINQERLTNVLAQERLTFSLIADYGNDLASTAERLEALRGRLPGQARPSSPAAR